MENEQVEPLQQEERGTQQSEVMQRPQERTAEWYWIIYRYGAARFLVWGWSRFRQ